MGKALFITGTGTDVGKTYVTGLIVRHLRQSGRNAGYYKAALSGAEPDDQGELQPGDAVYVNQKAERRYRCLFPMSIARPYRRIWPRV